MRERNRHAFGQAISPQSYWRGTWTPSAQVVPVVSFEWMRDENHGHLINYTDAEGKNPGGFNYILRDTGGELDHVKIKLTIDSPFVTSYQGYGGAKSTYVPAIWNSNDALVNRGFKPLELIRGVQSGISANTLTDNTVDGLVQNLLLTLPGLADLNSVGSDFVSAVVPTAPSVDLATAVAEILSERKFFSLPGPDSTLSGEWLNYNLAIAPLASVLRDLRETMEKAETLFAQYERDAGRQVRRRYEPPPEVVSSRTTSGGWSPVGNYKDLASYYAGLGGSWTCDYSHHVKRWFSGAFTYAPPPTGWRRTLSEWDRVYGVRPGLDTLWELLPLSFVLDYFGNLGDAIGNLTAFSNDGLVMPYGYVMETNKFSWDTTGKMTTNSPSTSYPVNFKVELEVRRRRRANPFGFGLLASDLSPRQWSILAALGIEFLR